MLIGGKRSTGMRTSVTVPTIAITRHATIMKNGYLIEKPDISFSLRLFRPGLRLPLAGHFSPLRNGLRFPTMTMSPSASPERTSTRDASSMPSWTRRSSTMSCGSTTSTVDTSPFRVTPSNGIVSTFFFSRRDNSVSVYIPGISFPLRFGTSISVSIVRVCISSESANRETLPSISSSSACTCTFTASPSRICAAIDSGTGRTSRSIEISASRTTGIACVLARGSRRNQRSGIRIAIRDHARRTER